MWTTTKEAVTKAVFALDCIPCSDNLEELVRLHVQLFWVPVRGGRNVGHGLVWLESAFGVGQSSSLAIIGELTCNEPCPSDPCRYHKHRQLGLPCYKRSRDSVFSQLEFAVRCGIGSWDEEDDDGDSGFVRESVTLQEYEACVESLGVS